MRIAFKSFAASALGGACAIAFCAAAIAAPVTDVEVNQATRRAQFQQRFFDKLDTNHDGTVSRTEYQAWVDARFGKLDANRDGKVDASEMANSAGNAERAQKRADRFVKRYAPDGTGSVSKADFEARELARFDRIGGGADALTPDQLASTWRQGGPRHAARGDVGAPPATE